MDDLETKVLCIYGFSCLSFNEFFKRIACVLGKEAPSQLLFDRCKEGKFHFRYKYDDYYGPILVCGKTECLVSDLNYTDFVLYKKGKASLYTDGLVWEVY